MHNLVLLNVERVGAAGCPVLCVWPGFTVAWNGLTRLCVPDASWQALSDLSTVQIVKLKNREPLQYPSCPNLGFS